ncbi:MAG: hypothetical protein M3388_02220 [Acidobacteriota bacterium]|nr:hypothetical protein [Acidobacteriota bacterium]
MALIFPLVGELRHKNFGFNNLREWLTIWNIGQPTSLIGGIKNSAIIYKSLAFARLFCFR